MACRGLHMLSRMLITFSDLGASSKGMIEYLETSGKQLKNKVEKQGGQLVVEVRRNAEPQIQVCYFGGKHVQRAHSMADAWLRRQAGTLWKPPKQSIKSRLRRKALRRKAGGMSSHNPTLEKRELMQRLMNLDTVGGIRANVTRLGSFTPPDRSHPFRMVEEFKRAALMHAAEAGETEREEEEVHGEMRGVAVDRDSGDEAREAGLGGSSKGQEEGMEVETGDIKVEGKRAAQEAQWKVPKTYSIPLLMSMQAHLPYKPFAWPVWKVWGPSGKTVEVGNCSATRIKEHIWWLLRTTGRRSSKWGNNVDRQYAPRPTVQGMWDPATAARGVNLQMKISELPMPRSM